MSRIYLDSLQNSVQVCCDIIYCKQKCIIFWELRGRWQKKYIMWQSIVVDLRHATWEFELMCSDNNYNSNFPYLMGIIIHHQAVYKNRQDKKNSWYHENKIYIALISISCNFVVPCFIILGMGGYVTLLGNKFMLNHSVIKKLHVFLILL